MSKVVERPRFTCALGGAIGTIQALPRAIPILHSSAGCGGNLAGALSGASGYHGGSYCGGNTLPSSNVSERDIVFGGEERLTEQIENTLKVMDGDLYFVVTGCMVEMIGDDVHQVVKKFANSEHPVFGTETTSFKGNSYKGYDDVLQALIRDFVEPGVKREALTVNLLGIVPLQDVFWKGNIDALKELLSKLGLTVNTFFGTGETIDNLRYSAKAALNIVVSDVYGQAAADTFTEVHGVPSLTLPFPIGDHATTEFLLAVAKELELDKAAVDKAIGEERKIYYDFLQRLADSYNDLDFQRYATVVGDVNYAPALTRFLADDLGWLAELSIVTDPLLPDQEELVRKRFAGFRSGFAPEVVFDTDAINVGKHINRHWAPSRGQKFYEGFNPGFIIGSVMERDTAEALKVPLLAVSYPITNRVVLNRAYAGYKGGLTLAEDLISLVVAHR
ncbi:nitrogenase component 1 [Gorillibacterium massiliense]|uniref:nitrogenase component 1 n=1 Tax=Gorillibacterium massiliense TaxID=1280390 RepID=UPI0004B97E99|nr:nitrogenase component 1 [Gorillibacterium massiliense]